MSTTIFSGGGSTSTEVVTSPTEASPTYEENGYRAEGLTPPREDMEMPEIWTYFERDDPTPSDDDEPTSDYFEPWYGAYSC